MSFGECHNRYTLITPPEVAKTGTRFLTGGPGAAPGGVASKNGWVYMRVRGESISYSLESLSVFCVLSLNDSYFGEGFIYRAG